MYPPLLCRPHSEGLVSLIKLRWLNCLLCVGFQYCTGKRGWVGRVAWDFLECPRGWPSYSSTIYGCYCTTNSLPGKEGWKILVWLCHAIKCNYLRCLLWVQLGCTWWGNNFARSISDSFCCGVHWAIIPGSGKNQLHSTSWRSCKYPRSVFELTYQTWVWKQLWEL